MARGGGRLACLSKRAQWSTGRINTTPERSASSGNLAGVLVLHQTRPASVTGEGVVSVPQVVQLDSLVV